MRPILTPLAYLSTQYFKGSFHLMAILLDIYKLFKISCLVKSKLQRILPFFLNRTGHDPGELTRWLSL